MSDIQELERSITRAHQQGDTATLQRLQAEYRRTAGVVRVTKEPIRMVEASAPAQHVPRGGKSPAVRTVPTVAVITPDVRRQIINAEWRWGSAIECGYWLVGTIERDEMVVMNMYPNSGSDPVGEYGHVPLDMEWANVQDQGARSVGWTLLGYLHSHPWSIEPSSTDEDMFTKLARGLKQDILCLIAGEPGEGLLLPELRAHVAVHGDGSFRPLSLIVETEVY